MKTFLLAGLFFFISFVCFAKDIPAKEYYHRGGTYIKPTYRSNSEGDAPRSRSRPSYQQQKAYQTLPVTPAYKSDYDNDVLTEKDEKEEDDSTNEDSVGDDRDSYPYGTHRSYRYRESKDKSNTIGSFSDSNDTETKQKE
ncbi:MAG: hypothetical protein WCI77_03840 [Candidatus Omnitrophota bacterium]